MEKIVRSLEALKLHSQSTSRVFRPDFFRLGEPGSFEKFEKLLNTPGISVVDQIFDQVKELIKIRFPEKTFSREELVERVNAHFRDHDALTFGVWIYYPWSNRLVHVLDKDEFIDVRTSRNQYKITPAERETLARKKIGVIGLSVGQSVSLTLAMERVCGEIRLADFDLLELTNLNRIRTGVHNLGIAKVYSVAREIAEIDPYIDVICFPEGLTEKNMDEFFLGGGKLDLVVEESDGFDIKILSRYKARELRVPVIMEASDRCMVDVERFDLEPDRAILHGIVKELDVEKLKTLTTNEEKIPYMLDVLGFEKTSRRLRASMLEMKQTISTWPQLASAVTMGGGITADVSRRLLLGLFRSSGRYYVDVEQIICDAPEPAVQVAETVHHFVLPDLLSLSKNITVGKEKGQPLQKEIVEKIVRAACQAPSAGNQQPWRWVYAGNKLFVFNPFAGERALLAFENNAPFMAVGAAATNVVLKAAELNLKTEVNFFPAAKEGFPIMSFHFTPSTDQQPENLALAGAIERRGTNRMLGKRQPIAAKTLEQLQKTVSDFDPSFHVRFFTDGKTLEAQGKLLGELDMIRLLDPGWHREFVLEIKWTDEEANSSMDGVDLRTLDLTNNEKVGLIIARDPGVMAMVGQWKGGGAFSALSKKAVDSASAIGMIYTTDRSPEMFMKAGMAMQRMWLKATLERIGLQPLGAPVFMFAPLMLNKPESLAAHTVERLRKLRPSFEKSFEVAKHEKEVFIFRLAVAPEPPVRSLRKPIEEVFLYSDRS
jgi:molybdopterin/thiamine biosynthesis adenylyltransferase/nitroreductase